MMTTPCPTASSSRIDGLSRKLRQPSALKRKLSFLLVASTTTATSTRKMDSSRERRTVVRARRVGESRLGSTSSVSLTDTSWESWPAPGSESGRSTSVWLMRGPRGVVRGSEAGEKNVVGCSSRGLQVGGGGVHDGLGGGVGA